MVPPPDEDGGVQVPPLEPPPPQVQAQGRQLESLSQATAGHAQTHAPGSVGGGSVWQTPERHSCPAAQGTPMPYQMQVASAAQEVASAWAAQGSCTTCTHMPELPQSHAGHSLPGSQAGQAQAPMPYQAQALVVSAAQAVASPWALQGSTGAAPPSQVHGAHALPATQAGQVQLLVPLEPVEPPPLLVPLPTTSPEGRQSHAQGAQAALSGQAGQAQAQVPPLTQPWEGSLAWQSQAQGGHSLPASQGEQAQVQLPPDSPPPAQSHSIGGHCAPLGQETGLTQAQDPPETLMAWQKPFAPGSDPTATRSLVADQAHLASAAQELASW